METTFTIPNGDKAPDRWRCTCGSYQEFCATESSGPLGEAMSLWRLYLPAHQERATNPSGSFKTDAPRDAGSPDQEPPQFRDFNAPPSARLFKPSHGDAYHADVSAPSPHDFMWSAPGSPPVRLEDITSPLLQKTLAWDLLVCKELARPFYHQIEQDIDGVIHRYLRLLLPVVNGQGEVCSIFAFCRPQMTNHAQDRKQATKLI